MVAVAQLVEHSVVVRVVAGSNPVGHPINQLKRSLPSRMLLNQRKAMTGTFKAVAGSNSDRVLFYLKK